MQSCAGAGGLAQFQARGSFSSAWHIAMHRQDGGAVDVRRLWDHVSCSHVQGLVAWRNAQARGSFSSAWHIAMHRLDGGAVGVGACGIMSHAAMWRPFSVSVSGTVNRKLSVCGQCRFLVRGWLDLWDPSWGRAAFLWSGMGGDLGPCYAGRTLLVARTACGPSVLVVRNEHNVFAVWLFFTS